MKRILLHAGAVTAVLAIAALTFTATPRPISATVPDQPPVVGSAKRLAEVTAVKGKPVVAVTSGNQTAKAMAGELLVKTTTPDALRTIGEVEPTGLPGTYKVNLPADADLNVKANEVAAKPGVTAATPNYVVAATATPNDTLYSNQWALPKISAPSSWDKTTGSASVNIASLDTGVNWNHQDLDDREWINSGEIPDNDLDDDSNGYVDDYRGMDFVNATFSGGKYHNDANGAMDDEGHGSVTASLYAADTNNNLGVAGGTWQGKYIPVKVLDSTGFGTFEDVALGIRYASNVGAKVMNMSLGAFGVSSDFATNEAIDYAYGRGGVLVAASGNDGSTSVIDYPALNPKVIAVGSTTSTDERSSFSNGGPALDLVAPGSNVLAAHGFGGGVPINNQYAYVSGTSAATPYVSAAAALLAAVNPSITPDLVRQTLVDATDKVPSMSGQAYTNLYGFGRVNTRKALDALAPWSAQWAGQSSFATLASGEQTTAYIDYKNVGSQAWTNSGPTPVRLGMSHPKDRASSFYNTSWVSPTRSATITKRVNGDGSTTATTTINPGETARFEFTVTAPPVTSTTTFTEFYQPLAETAAWMQDYGVHLQFTVQPRTYAYQWVGQTYPPSFMQPGERRQVTLDLKNTGTGMWRYNTLQPFRVGTSRPRDRASAFANNTWISPSRVANFEGTVSGGTVIPSDDVAPGETARFSFDLVAPSQGGTYTEYFEPLVETYKWLGDIGISWQVTVPSVNYDYQYMGQSTYPAMNQGGTSTAWLRLKNTGRQTWNSSGPNAVKLGTSNPRDRQSGFSNNGTGQGWLSQTRVHLTRNLTDSAKNVGGETSIAPGETAEFEFTVTGGPPPGAYTEYFTPVVESVQWMKDIGINWIMSVEKPIQVGLAQQATFTGTSEGPVTFVDNSGTAMATVPAGQPLTLMWNESAYFGIWSGGSVTSPQPITAKQESIHRIFTVQNLTDNGGNNRFRGDLIIKNGGAGSWLINKLNLEEYLRGLGEVPDSWPANAIRAQVVAARTYAARRLENPQNSQFDIYDTTQDQVYNGYNNEIAKPNHVAAIGATKGVVIKRDGQLIQAFYSSDSGGATGNNEDIWGGSPINYLRGVTDPYEKPDIWSKTVSNAAIQSAYGHSGNIDGLNVTSWYASGRPRTIQLVTSGGNVTNHTLPADTHRTRLGLRSSRITGIGRSGNDWVFNGRGFGHGIGLSQWGAFNQANIGRGYDQILQFYYTGVTLGNLY